MTKDEFILLSLTEKLAFVYVNGSFLLYRETDIYHVSLYDCGDFLAEVWLYMETDDVDYVRAFTSVDILEPYLKQVSIESLLPEVKRHK